MACGSGHDVAAQTVVACKELALLVEHPLEASGDVAVADQRYVSAHRAKVYPIDLEVVVRPAAVIALSILLLGAPATAQETKFDFPVVVTSGEAEVKRAADRAWVTINAESRARDPKEAQRANVEAMNAVMQKLRGLSLGSDAVRTTSVELHPEFDYANGRQTLRGYVARNTIEVRVDEISRAGEVISATVGSGATSIGGLRFDIKDRAEAEREALRIAVQNARARAEAAASGAGMRIDRIVRIEDHRTSMPEPRPMMMERTMAAQAPVPDTPVTPGNLTIRAMVTVTAALK
jgi:uncharacterized protein YggE